MFKFSYIEEKEPSVTIVNGKEKIFFNKEDLDSAEEGSLIWALKTIAAKLKKL